MENFYTIKNNVETEIIEKKSKFIANLIKVESQDDAENVIKKLKKNYFDAKHNCFAYRIMEENSMIEKSSDDGEPSGTAGAPMLNILQKNNMCNILVVVTRYFGGILLGTGGLVRAYSDVTIKSINLAEIQEATCGEEASIELDYNNLESFKYYCKNNDFFIENIEYLDKVKCKIILDENKKDELLSDFATKKVNLINLEFITKKIMYKSKVK